LPVVVVGAGPVGLAAAAHLIERGMNVVVLEAGLDVAAHIREWSHVRLFSPWRYNVDRAAARVLEKTAWTPPLASALPTGAELVSEYLLPLSHALAAKADLRFDARVVAVSRKGMGKVRNQGRDEAPFVVRCRSTDGRISTLEARALIDASGTWSNPNPLGGNGLPAEGEAQLAHLIHYGIPDVLGQHAHWYAAKTTLVVGAGHSAANSILALAELASRHPGTQVIWATRGSNLARILGGGAADGLPARGKLGSDLQALVTAKKVDMLEDFTIDRLDEVDGKLRVSGVRGGEPLILGSIDGIIAATGQRPDLQVLREVRLSLDPTLECVTRLADLIDPNVHSCGTVRPHGAAELAQPEPGLYVIGAKSYGRAPTFLMATGYEQARSVVAHLAGDVEAAARVELQLPATGVCNSQPKTSLRLTTSCGPSSSGCC